MGNFAARRNRWFGTDADTEESMKAISIAAVIWLIFMAPNSLICSGVDAPERTCRGERTGILTLRRGPFPATGVLGDTHHHSSYSFDSACLFGNTLGPEDSFRFALGEEVVASNGVRAKLIRPLDFLVVSDHAAYLGFTDLMRTSDPRLMATKGGREMVEGYQAGGEEAWLLVVSMMKDFDIGKPRLDDPELTRSVWESVVDIASRYNDPGAFTAFNGYEWTSAPTGNNLHRVVIFRDGPERAKQIVPFSAFDSDEPEPLWEFLASYEEKDGWTGPGNSPQPEHQQRCHVCGDHE